MLLPDGVVLEVKVAGQRDWRLSLRQGKNLLVEYSSAGGYEFKSVEKLRYDFQRDAENALRQG